MAISVTSSPVDAPAGLRISVGKITFDSSYLSGGEPVTAAQFGAAGVGHSRLPDFVLFNGDKATATTEVSIAYDRAHALLHLYQGVDAVAEVNADFAEVASTTDESAKIFEFLAFWVNPGTATTI